MYPEYALIDGKKYKINTDYRIATKCFTVINDNKINDTERAMAIIYLLFGFIPDDNMNEFLEKAKFFLSCGKPEAKKDDEERDIDFEIDKGYIMASFMSDYNLDISNREMHFWQYIDLIAGLTKKSIMSRVREIRNYDLSEISDPEQRRKMAKAQADLALPEQLTAEEQEAVDRFESLFGD